MKLTVLGRSGGFPLPGEATSGYLIQTGNKNILLDCGSGVLANLLRCFPVEKLDLLILTHLHADHQSDLGVLKYAMNMTRRTGQDVSDLPVYLPASPETMHPSADGLLSFHTLTKDTCIEMDGLSISFVPGVHPVECYAVRIASGEKVFAYTGDTRMCDRVDDMLRGADLAVLDAGGLERTRMPEMVHMTAKECAEAAERNGVRQPLLSHIVPFNDPDETLQEARAHCKRVEIAQHLGVYEA